MTQDTHLWRHQNDLMRLGLHSSRGGGEFLGVQVQTCGLHKTGRGHKMGFEADKRQTLWRWDCALYHANSRSCHNTKLRITDYSELEGPHRDHQVRL